MDTTSSAVVAEFWSGIANVARTCGTPGANILLARGVRRQRTMMREVLKAFAAPVQLLGGVK
jgi:hypothetical protein